MVILYQMGGMIYNGSGAEGSGGVIRLVAPQIIIDGETVTDSGTGAYLDARLTSLNISTPLWYWYTFLNLYLLHHSQITTIRKCMSIWSHHPHQPLKRKVY